MSGSEVDTAGAVALGPFEVAVDPDAVVAFAAACGAPERPIAEPTATFPAIWLSLPGLKLALRAVLGPDHLPVHESQSFDYEQPLQTGARYVLSGLARRETRPDRLVVTAQAVGADGRVAVAIRSVLRIVAIAGETA